MSKLTELITVVSRIPGLRFFNQFNRHIRTAENFKKRVDSFKKKGEEEAQNTEKEQQK